MTAPLVAIGIGNVLLTDDGIGVRVIDGLRAVALQDPHALPPGTELVDGGTGGLDLLRVVEGARGLVLVDAVRLGGPAGTVSIVHGDAIIDAGGHRDGRPTSATGELVAAARTLGWLPDTVALVGIEVADIELGVRLSPAVDEALPVAMDTVLAELRRMDARPTTSSTGGDAAGRMAGATA